MQINPLSSEKEGFSHADQRDEVPEISSQDNGDNPRSLGRKVGTSSKGLRSANDIKWIKGRFSPGYNLAITIGGIAIAEVIAMIIVYFYRFLPYYQQVLMDAAVMTVIIFPLLYFLSTKPLLQHIQQQIRTESLLQARLRLIQFAVTHTLDELLQATLDEMETLTSSAISYFYFLADDQKTLRLQAWSSNTLRGKYTVLSGDGHYDFDPDILAKCIEQRQPVIHNYRTKWSYGEGISERDASVTREMAVPIMRAEKVVAILGTGNKPQNFTTSDVELVSTLADFAWDIVKHKQAEKDISERNQKEKLLTQTLHAMQLDIARDLHDTVGQNISFLRMKLDYLAERKIRKQAEMQVEIQSMARAANESYDLIRGTLAVLQSENSADLSRWFTRYAEQIEERSSFKIDFSSRGEPRLLSVKRMRQLFYIFREVLNNIEKHANASQVSMEMTWDEDCLTFVVFDNGRGFDPDKVQYGSHYGIKFMKERAELLNGSLTVHSAIGSGTNIILQAPYE